MRLLYLSYWSAAEGLTQATVLPHLEVLEASSRVERLVFATVERGAPGPAPALGLGRATHVGLRARALRPAVAARALDFLELPRRLARLAREERLDYVLARG